MENDDDGLDTSKAKFWELWHRNLEASEELKTCEQRIVKSKNNEGH